MTSFFRFLARRVPVPVLSYLVNVAVSIAIVNGLFYGFDLYRRSGNKLVPSVFSLLISVPCCLWMRPKIERVFERAKREPLAQKPTSCEAVFTFQDVSVVLGEEEQRDFAQWLYAMPSSLKEKLGEQIRLEKMF